MKRALYTNELDTFGKCHVKNYLGTFAFDQLPERVQLPQAALIVNTEPIAEAGQHWLAMLFRRDCVLFFDSYGNRPEFYGLDGYLKDQRRNVEFNSVQYQCWDTTVCGQHCAYFLSKFPNLHYKNNCLVNDSMVARYFDSFPLVRCSCSGQSCSTKNCRSGPCS